MRERPTLQLPRAASAVHDSLKFPIGMVRLVRMHDATDCAVCTISGISLLGLVRLVSGLSLLFSPRACRFRGRMVLLTIAVHWME